MSLKARVAKLEAAAADLERDREVLTHRVSKLLEECIAKLENPSAVAWLNTPAKPPEGYRPMFTTRFLDGSAAPSQDLSEWLAI